MKRAILELSAALIALVGCVWSWLAAATPAQIEPVVTGEPAQASVNYDPTMLSLALLLATVAGVLVVMGVGGLRRTR